MEGPLWVRMFLRQLLTQWMAIIIITSKPHTHLHTCLRSACSTLLASLRPLQLECSCPVSGSRRSPWLSHGPGRVSWGPLSRCSKQLPGAKMGCKSSFGDARIQPWDLGQSWKTWGQLITLSGTGPLRHCNNTNNNAKNVDKWEDYFFKGCLRQFPFTNNEIQTHTKGAEWGRGIRSIILLNLPLFLLVKKQNSGVQ